MRREIQGERGAGERDRERDREREMGDSRYSREILKWTLNPVGGATECMFESAAKTQCQLSFEPQPSKDLKKMWQVMHLC